MADMGKTQLLTTTFCVLRYWCILQSIPQCEHKEKLMHNGQTKPGGVTRSCIFIQREVKFVRSSLVQLKGNPFCGFLHENDV